MHLCINIIIATVTTTFIDAVSEDIRIAHIYYVLQLAFCGGRGGLFVSRVLFDLYVVRSPCCRKVTLK